MITDDCIDVAVNIFTDWWCCERGEFSGHVLHCACSFIRRGDDDEQQTLPKMGYVLEMRFEGLNEVHCLVEELGGGII